MLTIEPRALLRKLNPVCTRAIQSAAAACFSSRQYEVTVEHVLSALLDDSESDVALILGHYGADAGQANSEVRRVIASMRTGHSGHPVFSPLLMEWLQDALLLCVAERGESTVRSVALLLCLIASPQRYSATQFAFLGAVNRDELRARSEAACGKSAESQGASAAFASDVAEPAAGQAAEGHLARFTADLTAQARAGKLDPVYGRDAEIRLMIEILLRRRKNNPIIVGEAGVGKTALVEGLAQRIVSGQVPERLAQIRLLALDLGAMQAGAAMRGEFEQRLKGVLTEVQSSTVPIVLFIDEAHTIIGAGGPQGGGDAANLLKPALARGELRTIAATTYAEFKRYFEKDAALERRFHPVRVDEPSTDAAILMLRSLVPRLQETHGVVIRDKAVVECVRLSSRYISGRKLPDKAVDLLDTAAAHVKLLHASAPSTLDDAQAALLAVEHELQAYARDERAGLRVDATLRNVASSRHETLTRDVATLTALVEEQRVSAARIEALREEFLRELDEKTQPTSAISFQLAEELAKLDSLPLHQRLVTADVDESVVAAVVSEWTGIPVGKMVKDDLAILLKLDQHLRDRIRGQDPALAVIARELQTARSEIKLSSSPLGVFLLVGPSGVGKTETALALADLLFGGERFVVTINMSEFQERHSVSRLIGSPPGYVGYGQGGVLTEAVRHRPYSVVLLDEVEKADREVLNLFYQVFDKGTLADGEGRVIDFKHTVILLTSNLATEQLTEACRALGARPDADQLLASIRPTLSRHFQPALLARMTVVPYIPLCNATLREIIGMKLAALVQRLEEAHGIELHFAESIATMIAERCNDGDSGARNIDHILRCNILPAISQRILEAMVDDVVLRRISVDLDARGALRCESTSATAAENAPAVPVECAPS